MIINKSGLTIRMDVSTLRVMGRATQGVRLINLKGSDSIAAVTKVMKDEEEEAIAIDGEELEVDPNAVIEDDADDDDVVENQDEEADDADDDSEE
jgi:DNA gyrase subunit A